MDQVHPRWREFWLAMLEALGCVINEYGDASEKTAVREVLPRWRDIFRQSFSRQLQDPNFNIWHLITPTINIRDLLRAYFEYIETHKTVSTPVAVELPPSEVSTRLRNNCLRPRRPLQGGEQPVGTATSSRRDPNFFHICPYCGTQDENKREDAICDHIVRIHKVDKNANPRRDRRRNIKQLKRMSRPVLAANITDERKLLNLYRRLIRNARASVVELQGRQPAPNNDVDLDEEGNDLWGFTKPVKSNGKKQGVENHDELKDKDDLADILMMERGVFDAVDWKEEVRREAQLAWDEAKKQRRDGSTRKSLFNLPTQLYTHACPASLSLDPIQEIMTNQTFQHVGIIGAGIGGLACAIAIRHHSQGALQVTILESAAELGEIGAGIQMTPNVARLLQRWGVADVIGSNLVTYDRMNLRTKDGRVVGRTDAPGNGGPERWAGAPWWLVHRMHLHDGLVQVARQRGVELVTGARVAGIKYQVEEGERVHVRDVKGRDWDFDLVIGADGLNSITRKTILPDVTPTPPTNLAAYRATVPMEKVKGDPITRELVEKPTINVWMGAKEGEEHGYVITYPISGGNVYNMVLSHHKPNPVFGVEDVSLAEVRETYKHYDPRLRRVLEMITERVRRWPLLVTRCPTWSSPQKNVVLMGDAAHSMVNHLAQGAATAMEDGAFLGVILREVAKGRITLREAIAKYEDERVPLADLKQQKSFVMGVVYHLEDESPEQLARDEHMKGELRGEQLIRTPNLNADPHLWRTVFAYDPEEHAEKSVQELLQKQILRNPTTHVTRDIADTYMNYWLPNGNLKKGPSHLEIDAGNEVGFVTGEIAAGVGHVTRS
ncbi:hypothetical protein VMCG_00867 [Cytospora schulzeri]|uniref:FAD-binding domain-containing protein n=1 Tax=Cytospora schulzeri TaxID=448051 RepID=A0A423X5S6_9PEZI|nr:hypothetical protein VMCG_00867 [Valsa malicola]